MQFGAEFCTGACADKMFAECGCTLMLSIPGNCVDVGLTLVVILTYVTCLWPQLSFNLPIPAWLQFTFVLYNVCYPWWTNNLWNVIYKLIVQAFFLTMADADVTGLLYVEKRSSVSLQFYAWYKFQSLLQYQMWRAVIPLKTCMFKISMQHGIHIIHITLYESNVNIVRFCKMILGLYITINFVTVTYFLHCPNLTL